MLRFRSVLGLYFGCWQYVRSNSIPDMKLRITSGLALTLLTSAVIAQSTKPEMSQIKSRQDPVTTANQPITAKSAMPQTHHSSTFVPKASASDDKNNAELTSLERKRVVASKPAPAPQIRLKTTQPRPTAASSDINASYQKPNPKKN